MLSRAKFVKELGCECSKQTTSAANLKFLSVLRQVRHRNFKFKAALETKIDGAPLISKFASGVTAIACELRNRSSSAAYLTFLNHKRQVRPRNVK